MSLFSELKRRNVFRIGLAYLVTAWLVMQVGDTMVPALHLPDWTASLLAFFLILGFPFAIFFAWAFEMTPDGLRREQDIGQQGNGDAFNQQKLNRMILLVLTLALAYFAVERLVFNAPAQVDEVVATPVSPAAETASGEAVTSDSIAVLPFVNMSSDPEQEYFSDGLTEELLNLLAGIKELKVAARTSSFYYKDKLDDIPLTEIARQLGVAHVLEGSVRKSGNTVRITVQLIEASGGFHLWSETYDRDLDDIFSIQDEIAAAVTKSLHLTLLGGVPSAVVLDTRSFELSLQARYFYSRRAEGDLQRALELYQQAVVHDPGNIDAWVGMAPLYLWLFDPPEVALARNAIETAIELNPLNPEAQARLGNILYQEGHTEDGWAKVFYALELGPDNPLVLAMIAGYYQSRDINQTIKLQQRALAADPLHVVNLSNMAHYLVEANRLDEAEKYARKAFELAPSSPLGKSALARLHLLKGDAETALQMLQDLPLTGLELVRDVHMAMMSMAQYSLGNREAADLLLEKFNKLYGEQDTMGLAYIHAWRGENDLAFECIQRTFDLHPGKLSALPTNPYLANLHDDPRWGDVLGRYLQRRTVEPRLIE